MLERGGERQCRVLLVGRDADVLNPDHLADCRAGRGGGLQGQIIGERDQRPLPAPVVDQPPAAKARLLGTPAPGGGSIQRPARGDLQRRRIALEQVGRALGIAQQPAAARLPNDDRSTCRDLDLVIGERLA